MQQCVCTYADAVRVLCSFVYQADGDLQQAQQPLQGSSVKRCSSFFQRWDIDNHPDNRESPYWSPVAEGNGSGSKGSGQPHHLPASTNQFAKWKRRKREVPLKL